MRHSSVSSYDVLGVRVSALNLELAAQAVLDMIARRSRGYVCVAPVSTIVDARRDSSYREIVNQAALVTPDGMPVVWLGKRRAGAHVSRTYGPDLMLKLCATGEALQWRHFFYGGTPDVCDKLESRLREKFPGLIVAGRIAPPYMKEARQASQDVIDAINAARPDILWVGLGSPKQDRWMALNREALEVPVMIGIGAAFDFHAGVKKQAPRWMQQSGLEWLFRLLSEPRRLWKRYLIGNALFLWWLLIDTITCRASARPK